MNHINIKDVRWLEIVAFNPIADAISLRLIEEIATVKNVGRTIDLSKNTTLVAINELKNLIADGRKNGMDVSHYKEHLSSLKRWMKFNIDYEKVAA